VCPSLSPAEAVLSSLPNRLAGMNPKLSGL
jgi:hypothetical protein